VTVLADAAQRLRRPPGRPKTAVVAPSPDPPAAMVKRLLDLAATASYLSVSVWTVRDLEHAGTLRRVRVPLPRGGELRKLLFDREDLDELIRQWKADA
jgi:hypothetical protein